jgi:hypothetical protein
LHALLAAAEPRDCELWVYRNTGNGWQATTLENAATATFRMFTAEAVVCARLQL